MQTRRGPTRNVRGRSRSSFPRISASVPRTTSVKRTARYKIPKIRFDQITRAVLGPRYELSLVICGDGLARRVNRAYRKKDHAANVLSFSISRTEGEMFLNARASAREARRYGVSVRARLALLFVHGLLHLKGLPHGRTMEREERRVLRAFDLEN